MGGEQASPLHKGRGGKEDSPRGGVHSPRENEEDAANPGAMSEYHGLRRSRIFGFNTLTPLMEFTAMIALLLLISCWLNEEAVTRKRWTRSMRTTRFSTLAPKTYLWMILVRLNYVTTMVRLLLGSHWSPEEVANPVSQELLAVRRTWTLGCRTLIRNYSYHDERGYESSKQRLARRPFGTRWFGRS